LSETSPHYLVITIGTTGDMHPLMRIASTLQALGRRVTFITNTYHANLVQSAGFEWLGLGSDEDYLQMLANPDIWDSKKCFSTLMSRYGDLLQKIDEAIQFLINADTHQNPKFVISHPLTLPGAVIARERGLVQSVVATYLAPSNLRTCHDPLTVGDISVPSWVPMSWRRALWWLVDKVWVDPVAVAQINKARQSMGLPKIDSFFTHMAESPDLSLTLFPAWFAPAPPDWPRPLISGDFQLFEAHTQNGFTPELSAFLNAGDKPLVVTAGTGQLHAAEFFNAALSAVQKLGRRAIFLSKARGQIPAHLPPSVLWQAYVPFSELLAHAAALMHHGGIGTTAEALRAGTPQLIAPFAWDQFDNGARIAALGVGLMVPAKRLKPAKLAQSLQALCGSESIRAQCAVIAARFKPAHDPTEFCREVDGFLQARYSNAAASLSSSSG
jgi:rhamnosyltransferase subunit B